VSEEMLDDSTSLVPITANNSPIHIYDFMGKDE
jgi:hypothetical protein